MSRYVAYFINKKDALARLIYVDFLDSVALFLRHTSRYTENCDNCTLSSLVFPESRLASWSIAAIFESSS